MKRGWFRVLRVATAMCFVGHGAFGVMTKHAWVPYFAVAGIGAPTAYRLMPLIGVLDISLGATILFRPTRAALAYMTGWAVWTAVLRPLAGQGFAECLERAGNYGVPAALLFASSCSWGPGGWFSAIGEPSLDAPTRERVLLALRLTTAALLMGHGILAARGKPLLVAQWIALGAGTGAGTIAAAQGWLEVATALAVLAAPSAALLLVVFLWKVATELLFPITGAPIWEFVERGGSYGAPLALAMLTRGHRIGARARVDGQGAIEKA